MKTPDEGHEMIVTSDDCHVADAIIDEILSGQNPGSLISRRAVVEMAAKVRRNTEALHHEAVENEIIRLKESLATTEAELKRWRDERKRVVRFIKRDSFRTMSERRGDLIQRDVYQRDLSTAEAAELDCLQMISSILPDLAFELPIDMRDELYEITNRLLGETADELKKLRAERESTIAWIQGPQWRRLNTRYNVLSRRKNAGEALTPAEAAEMEGLYLLINTLGELAFGPPTVDDAGPTG